MTGAVALLAVNDHVFKGRGPSWFTGKASDVAGVFVITLVIGILTGRRDVAAVATAVGFAALKLSPEVASLAAPALGGATRTDATDLIAVVMVVPAHALLARGCTSTTATSTALLRTLVNTAAVVSTAGAVAVLVLIGAIAFAVPKPHGDRRPGCCAVGAGVRCVRGARRVPRSALSADRGRP